MIPSTLPINMYMDGLKLWQWAIPYQEIQPLVLSTFGDWIFNTKNDGVVHLSILDGSIIKIADSPDDLGEALNDPSKRDEWLLEGWIIRCNNEKMQFELGKCLGWKLQPIVGGKFDYGNISTYDPQVYWHATSQIIQQSMGRVPQ